MQSICGRPVLHGGLRQAKMREVGACLSQPGVRTSQLWIVRPKPFKYDLRGLLQTGPSAEQIGPETTPLPSYFRFYLPLFMVVLGISIGVVNEFGFEFPPPIQEGLGRGRPKARNCFDG